MGGTVERLSRLTVERLSRRRTDCLFDAVGFERENARSSEKQVVASVTGAVLLARWRRHDSSQSIDRPAAAPLNVSTAQRINGPTAQRLNRSTAQRN